jgi:hypothetical protein
VLNINTEGSVLSCSRSSSPRKLLDPEYEGNTILQIVEKYPPTDRLSKATQTNTIILIVTTMTTSESKLIDTVCQCSKCCAMFSASSSLGVKWMNYIGLVLSCKVCGSVPPAPQTSSKCVVLFIEIFTSYLAFQQYCITDTHMISEFSTAGFLRI